VTRPTTRTRITIRRDSEWDVQDWLGLSRKVHVETNPVSQRLATVDLTKVKPLPCLNRRGKPVSGIDMVQGYSDFHETRSKFIRHAFRRLVQWRMNPLFGANTYIPLGPIIVKYCDGRAEIFDHLVNELGITDRPYPVFCADGGLIDYPSWEDPSIVAFRRGFKGIYNAFLLPAFAVRTGRLYSLTLQA